jgi:hypothetical protein
MAGFADGSQGNVFRHFAAILNAIIFLLLITGLASLVVSGIEVSPACSVVQSRFLKQAVQMLRGDIDPETTQLSFDNILTSFYAMYQVSLSGRC